MNDSKQQFFAVYKISAFSFFVVAIFTDLILAQECCEKLVENNCKCGIAEYEEGKCYGSDEPLTFIFRSY
jgi:hypothetical protein